MAAPFAEILLTAVRTCSSSAFIGVCIGRCAVIIREIKERSTRRYR
jgi:hypothetical protein